MKLASHGSNATEGAIIPELSSVIGCTTLSPGTTTRLTDGSLSLVLVTW